MKKLKPIFLGVLLLMAIFFVGIVYKNYYIKGITEENLGVLTKAVKNGQLRDYHNTIGVKSAEDVYYTHDTLFGLYKIYFGNYTIYLSDDENSSWSPEALYEPLGSLGLTFDGKSDQRVFYYFGQELTTPD